MKRGRRRLLNVDLSQDVDTDALPLVVDTSPTEVPGMRSSFEQEAGVDTSLATAQPRRDKLEEARARKKKEKWKGIGIEMPAELLPGATDEDVSRGNTARKLAMLEKAIQDRRSVAAKLPGVADMLSQARTEESAAPAQAARAAAAPLSADAAVKTPEQASCPSSYSNDCLAEISKIELSEGAPGAIPPMSPKELSPANPFLLDDDSQIASEHTVVVGPSHEAVAELSTHTRSADVTVVLSHGSKQLNFEPAAGAGERTNDTYSDESATCPVSAAADEKLPVTHDARGVEPADTPFFECEDPPVSAAPGKPTPVAQKVARQTVKRRRSEIDFYDCEDELSTSPAPKRVATSRPTELSHNNQRDDDTKFYDCNEGPTAAAAVLPDAGDTHTTIPFVLDASDDEIGANQQPISSGRRVMQAHVLTPLNTNSADTHTQAAKRARTADEPKCARLESNASVANTRAVRPPKVPRISHLARKASDIPQYRHTIVVATPPGKPIECCGMQTPSSPSDESLLLPDLFDHLREAPTPGSAAALLQERLHNLQQPVCVQELEDDLASLIAESEKLDEYAEILFRRRNTVAGNIEKLTTAIRARKQHSAEKAEQAVLLHHTSPQVQLPPPVTGPFTFSSIAGKTSCPTSAATPPTASVSAAKQPSPSPTVYTWLCSSVSGWFSPRRRR